MTPEDLIKYVFKQEGVYDDFYMLRKSSCRKRKLVQARQRSMYLIRIFFPYLTWDAIGQFFADGKRHDRAMHAYKTVSNFIETEKIYAKEMELYIKVLKAMNNKIINNSVVYKMPNKRVILSKTSNGFLILLKRLENKTIEKKYLNVSDEAMQAIVESYKLLNN
jgi:hypothetical protein